MDAEELLFFRAGMNLAKAKAEMDWRMKADQVCHNTHCCDDAHHVRDIFPCLCVVPFYAFPKEDRSGCIITAEVIMWSSQVRLKSFPSGFQEKDFFLERMKDELERLKNKLMRVEMRKLKVMGSHICMPSVEEKRSFVCCTYMSTELEISFDWISGCLFSHMREHAQHSPNQSHSKHKSVSLSRHNSGHAVSC